MLLSTATRSIPVAFSCGRLIVQSVSLMHTDGSKRAPLRECRDLCGCMVDFCLTLGNFLPTVHLKLSIHILLLLMQVCSCFSLLRLQLVFPLLSFKRSRRSLQRLHSSVSSRAPHFSFLPLLLFCLYLLLARILSIERGPLCAYV